MLVPMYTRIFTTDQYGVVTEMYAYVAFLIVILTYGMETAFFRFSSKAENKTEIYSSTLISILVTSTIFISLTSLFSVPIANWLRYPNHTEYVIWFAIIVGLDALSAIPMAKLRELEKAKLFVGINLVNIFVNIGLNLFFLVYCRNHFSTYGEASNWLIKAFYNPDIGVGYVFISNLVATVIRTLLLLPQMLKINFVYNMSVIRKMLVYSLPLLIAGLAGIVNETVDRVMIKRILMNSNGELGARELKETIAMTKLGIYGACYKVSIIITIFIQAFRYAAEPFFFTQQKEANAQEVYRDVMNYFIIAASSIFLVIMLYIDLVMLFVGKDFRVGVTVVPILLMANICLGIFFNLSIWYKLTGKTMYGAFIALFGATITIVLNYLWIPSLGYMGSAWATLFCYLSMTILSYVIGQRHYPINYNVLKGIGYPLSVLFLYYISTLISPVPGGSHYFINTVILLLFVGVVFIIETPRNVSN